VRWQEVLGEPHGIFFGGILISDILALRAVFFVFDGKVCGVIYTWLLGTIGNATSREPVEEVPSARVKGIQNDSSRNCAHDVSGYV